jgi:hypothetical protein
MFGERCGSHLFYCFQSAYRRLQPVPLPLPEGARVADAAQAFPDAH